MHPEDVAPQPNEVSDFGRPRPFSPQFAELYRAREKLSAWIRALKEVKKESEPVAQKQQPSLETHSG
jgi:hypothetical protein